MASSFDDRTDAAGDTSSPRADSKGQRTRAEILRATLAHASRLGLEGISIGGLARETGLSKSGLYAHFESKERLQLDVLAYGAELFQERVIAPALLSPRGEPRLRALFENWLAWDRQPDRSGGCLFMETSREQDDRPGPLRAQLAELQSTWLAVLARAAREAAAEGHLSAEIDPEQLAYELFGLVLACYHFDRLLDDPDARRRALAGYHRLVGHEGA